MDKEDQWKVGREKANSTTKRFLWGMIWAGFLVPVLPRLIVPIILPGNYVDDMWSLMDFRAAFMFSLFTLPPFLLLAGVGWFHLRITEGSVESWLLLRNSRMAGIVGAFIATLCLGLYIHMPQTAGGVNFGVVFFPFYSLYPMPIGYALGRVIVWPLLSILWKCNVEK